MRTKHDREGHEVTNEYAGLIEALNALPGDDAVVARVLLTWLHVYKDGYRKELAHGADLYDLIFRREGLCDESRREVMAQARDTGIADAAWWQQVGDACYRMYSNGLEIMVDCDACEYRHGTRDGHKAVSDDADRRIGDMPALCINQQRNT